MLVQVVYPGRPGRKLGRSVPQRAAEELLMHLRAAQLAVTHQEAPYQDLRRLSRLPGSSASAQGAAAGQSLFAGGRMPAYQSGRLLRHRIARTRAMMQTRKPYAAVTEPIGRRARARTLLSSRAMTQTPALRCRSWKPIGHHARARTLVSSRATTQAPQPLISGYSNL